MNPTSLRGRLGALTAAGGFLLTAASVTALVHQQWREDTQALPIQLEADAYRLADLYQGPSQQLLAALATSTGTDLFVVVLDDAAEVIASAGPADDTRLALSQDIWEETTDADVVYSDSTPSSSGATITASGSACLDTELCDTVVVGGSAESLGSYLLGRVGWILGPALAVAMLALLTSRLMVNRALTPVDHMRAELDTIAATHIDRRVPVPDTGDELERLGTTINRTLDRLEASANATERFAADAAHELRSPITGVRAAVELRAGEDPLLQRSLAELDRASRLIDDLLVLARSEAVQLQRTEVDVDDVVRQDIAFARSRYPDVSIEASLEPVRVLGVSDDIRRIITNLVDNAIRYSNGRVQVTVSAQALWCCVRVDDDGPGIAPDQHLRVFERFARTDESRSRSTGGSGLGLALVHDLTVAHQGTISLGRADLGGARFDLKLPLAPSTGTI